jgi:hypothetical protein
MNAPRRTKNYCRVPHSLPDAVMRAAYSCDVCDHDVPKGAAPHVEIPTFVRCIETGWTYAEGEDGLPLRHDGLPVPVTFWIRNPGGKAAAYDLVRRV